MVGMSSDDEHYQPHPRDAAGNCLCMEACCNEMRYADDGDGYVDAIPERNTCPQVASAEGGFTGIGDILSAASGYAGQLHLMGLGHAASLAAAEDDLDLGGALRRRWAEMEDGT
jgi:hypothetical protein